MDTITKHVTLRAPIERVWRAISDSTQFGTWFGCELDGPFVAGQRITGCIRPTKVDPEVAAHQQPHDGVRMEWLVERIEPMRLFSFRWHPYGADPATDPMTLVELELEAAGSTTRLTIRESGFDQIPLERRARAFTANDGGWAMQAQLIARYVEA